MTGILRSTLPVMLAGALLAQQPPLRGASGPASPPASALRVVVLDAAHGGDDAGARTEGAQEKELVLLFTRLLRAEFLRRGFRVISTRDADQSLTFDDRAALANAQRGAVFLTVHVGSGGAPGTARAYYFPGFAADAPLVPRRGFGPLPWDRAQEPFLELSRRLADLVQVQFSRRFAGSPEISIPAAVRQLRSVAAPALAVEISNVTAERRTLEQMAPRVAEAVGAALVTFRPLYDAATPPAPAPPPGVR